ncbi:MAG TPA: DUF1801 domain-containing protein [Anaerolineales bacterium]|nr:DUF1801 domain-containing protein [Anaerolineales bacterium]
MKKPATRPGTKVSQQIAAYISSFDDWRGPMLSSLRKTIGAGSPALVEDWKWGTPVWSSNGLVCSASAFKDHVKVTFFQGARLRDPSHLFNAGLEAKTMRSVDFHQGDRVPQAPLKAMVKAAVAHNAAAKGNK